MLDQETKVMHLDDLFPADYNPRLDLQPGDEEYEKLKKSIQEFGYVEKIIWNKQTGNMVGGHQRKKVLQDLGYEEVIVTVIDETEEREKMLNVALNKIGGDWDFPKLKDLLIDLDTGEHDLELTGYDLGEIEDLMTQVHMPEGETEAIDDDFDVDEELENIIEPVTKRGDIWQLGKHRLMCGDSTKEEDVRTLMNGIKADMVFTDPPYNIDYGNIKHPKFKQRSIENDNMSKEDFDVFCEKFILNLKNFTSGCIYMAGPPGPDGRIMFSQADKHLHCSTTIIWNKDSFTLGRGKYQNKYEPIWFGWVDSGKGFTEDRTLTNVWDINRPKKSELHPTMKPIELVATAIQHNPGSRTVLDLFGGSGTTVMACEQTNREGYVMELDEKYCDVIINRWEQYTGEKAIKVKLRREVGENNATSETDKANTR